MTTSAKRLLAIVGATAALPLLAALLLRHPRSEAAPAAADAEEATPDAFAEARNRVPRLRWSPKPASAPSGLCGTEIPRADSGRGRVPPAFHDLTAAIPTAEAVAEAAEAWLGDADRVIDVAELSARGAEIRADLEREVGQALDESNAEEMDWLRRIEQLGELGRSDEALRLATRAHDRWRNDHTIGALATTMLHADRHAEARNLVETELAHGAVTPEARSWLTLYRGYACSLSGDYPCADSSTAVLASSTEKWMAPFLQGYSQSLRGRLAEAQPAYQQALANDPAGFSLLNNMAEAATCLGAGDAEARWAEAANRAETPEEIGLALAGVGYAYLSQGDAARAWTYAAGALTSSGDGQHAAAPRMLLALTSLSLADLGEARRQIQPVAGPGSPRNPLLSSSFVHPAEAASLRALIAEARGDANAAKLHWISVVKSGHPVLSIAARHALGELCPEG